MPYEGVASTIKIGVAGWSYEDWNDTVYPRGLPAGERLPYLVRYFDALEINSTFYANPRPSLVSRWVDVAARQPGFLFACKINRALTHEASDLAAEAKAFRAAVAPLIESKRCGAYLAQFPWYFRATPASVDRLRALADVFADIPLVLELRHRSFLSDEVLGFLRDRGVGLANIDLPASSTSLPPSSFLFGPVGYFRFHGRNSAAWFDRDAGRDEKYNYLYRPSELAPWTERIREVAARAETTFVIANNHFRGQAPANALDCARLLGQDREIPEPLGRTYPHLARP